MTAMRTIAVVSLLFAVACAGTVIDVTGSHASTAPTMLGPGDGSLGCGRWGDYGYWSGQWYICIWGEGNPPRLQWEPIASPYGP